MFIGLNLPVLAAALHIGVRGTRVTGVDEVGVALAGQRGVTGTGDAVGGVAGAGTDVGCHATKGTVGDAGRVAVLGGGQGSEVLVGEEAGLGEAASIAGLVPPREGTVETALVAEDHLEGEEEVTVPDEELGVLVDVGHVHLVNAGQVLVAVLGRGEVAGGGLVDQALDGVDEGGLVRVGVLPPLVADVGVGAAGRLSRCLDVGGLVGAVGVGEVESVGQVLSLPRLVQADGLEAGEG